MLTEIYIDKTIFLIYDGLHTEMEGWYSKNCSFQIQNLARTGIIPYLIVSYGIHVGS